MEKTLKQVKKEFLTHAYRIRRELSADIHNWVEKLIAPDHDMIVFSLVMNTQNMALERGTYVEFSPTSGMVGPCKLSGNSCPIFEYVVFHKPIMEFIKIRVEVSRPARIHFAAKIESKGTLDPAKHGEEVVVNEAFEKPFFILAGHLYNYFPHGPSPICNKFSFMEPLEKVSYAQQK